MNMHLSGAQDRYLIPACVKLSSLGMVRYITREKKKLISILKNYLMRAPLQIPNRESFDVIPSDLFKSYKI